MIIVSCINCIVCRYLIFAIGILISLLTVLFFAWLSIGFFLMGILAIFCIFNYDIGIILALEWWIIAGAVLLITIPCWGLCLLCAASILVLFFQIPICGPCALIILLVVVGIIFGAIFGALIGGGVLAWFFSVIYDNHGAYSFAILLPSPATPLLGEFTQPASLGE